MGQVVAAFAYRNGRRLASLSLEHPEAWPKHPGDFYWVGIHEPDEAEMRRLQKRFGLHELAVEDALHAHQLPKVEVYDDQLFIVLRTARLEAGAIVLGETHIFVGDDFIITVRHGASASYTPLRKQLEASPQLLRHGVDYVLHGVLDFVVDGYRPVISQIEEEVIGMERSVLERPLQRSDIKRIFKLRRQLLRFRRVLPPMNEVCNRVEHIDLPYITAESRPYFRDVSDHVRHVQASSETLREILSFVFEASLLLEQQRQSEITRRFAAWAAILAVPTAIAGIYGMNFDVMPELHWRFGYPLVLLAIAGLCTGLYWQFRRSGWL
jgi:magnesium transporter